MQCAAIVFDRNRVPGGAQIEGDLAVFKHGSLTMRGNEIFDCRSNMCRRLLRCTSREGLHGRGSGRGHLWQTSTGIPHRYDQGAISLLTISSIPGLLSTLPYQTPPPKV